MWLLLIVLLLVLALLVAARRKPARSGARGGGAAKGAVRWVNCEAAADLELTEEEAAAVKEKIMEMIKKQGRESVPDDIQPLIINTRGSPGAGKSTMTDEAIRRYFPRQHRCGIVTFEEDEIAALHPRHGAFLKDAAGNVVEGHKATMWHMRCVDVVYNLVNDDAEILNFIREKRLNVILGAHFHTYFNFIAAGYYVVLVMVGADPRTIQGRVKARSNDNGWFRLSDDKSEAAMVVRTIGELRESIPETLFQIDDLVTVDNRADPPRFNLVGMRGMSALERVVYFVNAFKKIQPAADAPAAK